jgi:glycerol-1-phosphate dehydrogenase [NAD(P)+]
MHEDIFTDDVTGRSRSMEFPRNVQIGHGILPGVADMCRELMFGGSGIMITGNDTYAAAGRAVEEAVADAGYELAVHRTGNATLANVEAVGRDAEACRAKFILAVGGGSKIDIAKMASKNLCIPFISIPTSVSHDGIASDRASLKSDVGPKSVSARSPLAIIADTAVISRAPYRFLASGCADVVSNLTALKDWEFAHRLKNEDFSKSAYALSQYSAETIIENSEYIRPGLEESVRIALKPIIISGISMSVAGSSRPTSGSEHLFSHALDILHPGRALHGEQCGVGSIMMMYLHGGDWRRIKTALDNIGAPTTAGQLGLDREDVLDALTEAHKIRKDRFTILGDQGLNRQTAEVVAKVTGVI